MSHHFGFKSFENKLSLPKFIEKKCKKEKLKLKYQGNFILIQRENLLKIALYAINIY